MRLMPRPRPAPTSPPSTPPTGTGSSLGGGHAAPVTAERTTGPATAFFTGCAGLDALTDTPARHADAVAWLSAHLATLTTVVIPVARHALSTEGTLLTRHQRHVHAVEHDLRRLHGRLSGDSAMAHLSVEHVHADLLEHLRAQRDAQLQVATRLQATLPADAWSELVGRYTRQGLRAPTRPHPHLPHGRIGGPVAQHLTRAADRLLDVLDSRPVHALQVGYDCVDGGTDAQPGMPRAAS